MFIRQYLRKTGLFILRNIKKITLYKLVVVILSTVFTYAFVFNGSETEDNISNIGNKFELIHERQDNITRELIPETKYPPIVWWNPGTRLINETIECENNIKCDAFDFHHKLPSDTYGAYMFYASRLNFDDLPLPRAADKVIWALSHEESPKNVVELLFERGLSLFNFSSTFSRFSDVPFPLQYIEYFENITSTKHFIATSIKNKLLDKIAPIIFMSSNCQTFTDRNNYVKELMKYIDVDSYGGCLNNRQWPKDFPEDYLNNLDNELILSFVSRYKFAIAIENGVCEDYVTEKFWRPIKIGVVPIYFGSPSIRDWFPNNKSAVLIEDFPTPKLLSEYLNELLRNDTLYEEFLEHKTKGIISNKKLLDEIKARPYQTDVFKIFSEFECFICKKLHDMKRQSKEHVVTKTHYNCSKPISALSGKPMASELPLWDYGNYSSERVYKKVFPDSIQ